MLMIMFPDFIETMYNAIEKQGRYCHCNIVELKMKSKLFGHLVKRYIYKTKFRQRVTYEISFCNKIFKRIYSIIIYILKVCF